MQVFKRMKVKEIRSQFVIFGYTRYFAVSAVFFNGKLKILILV